MLTFSQGCCRYLLSAFTDSESPQNGAKFIEGAVVKILFRNANLVLDGYPKLQRSYDVLVEGDRIVSVPRTSINSDNAKVVELGGGTLMSGLIDADAYIIGLSLSPGYTSYPASAIAIAAANYLRNSLMNSFTSIRESGAADDCILRLLAKGKKSVVQGFYILEVLSRRPTAGAISA
jgi:imidazolonepropionase-like amidohydrolase